MEKNKNYQQQKETQRLYRSKKQQETQEKLKQIFNKTQKIINELSNYREKHIRQSSVSEFENPEYVNSFYIYKKQLSCVRVVDLALPSTAKPKSTKAVQTQYESNRLTEKQQTRSQTTHCLTQNSENKRSFNDLSTQKKSIMLFGQSSQKSYFPPSTVVVKEICLHCNKKNNFNSFKSVSKSRGKGISITSCSPSRSNGTHIFLRSEEKLKNKYGNHSRNTSNISASTPKISLFKNLFTNLSKKRIQS